MPQYDFDQQSPLLASLTVRLTEEELKAGMNEELKRLRKRVDLKGFRKGKAPLSALRKMMGNQVLSDLVDKGINEGLANYIDEQELDLIFAPLFKDNQQGVDVDARNLGDVAVSFDLALRPEFEIAWPDEPLNHYVLEVDDELVDDSIERLRKQNGEHKDVEKGIKENDIVNVQLRELDTLGQPVEGGLQNDFMLYTDGLADDFKQTLMGQDVGFKTEVKLDELEKDTNDQHIRRYYLEVDSEDEQDIPERFELEVLGIERLVPAELDEAFFEKFDPTGEVTDEAKLREVIAEDNRKGFARQGDILLTNQLIQQLVEKTEIPLDDSIMDRVRKDENQSTERFERGVRWMLIRSQYAKMNDIELEEADIRAAGEQRVLSMLGGQRPEWLTDDFMNNFIQRSMDDENQRNELVYSALETKITSHMAEQVEKKEVHVSADRFNEIIDEYNKSQAEEEE